jgi:hypothetical protein
MSALRPTEGRACARVRATPNAKIKLAVSSPFFNADATTCGFTSNPSLYIMQDERVAYLAKDSSYSTCEDNTDA